MPQNSFDLRAPGWNNDRRKARAKTTCAALRAALPNRRPLSGMEYGCGTGLIGLPLADSFSSLLLCDSSAGMLREAQQSIAEGGLAHVQTMQLDLLADPAPTSRFDCIFSSMVLHHIPNTAAILSAFAKCLAPNGRLLIVELYPDTGGFHAAEPDFSGHHGFNPAALALQAEQAGFTSVSYRPVFQGEKDVLGKIISYDLFLLQADKCIRQ